MKKIIKIIALVIVLLILKEFDEKMTLFSKIRDAGTTIDTPIVQFEGFEAKEQKVCTLLAQKIEAPVLSEREAKIIETDVRI